MEKTVEPSKDLVDVTRTPLSELRSEAAHASDPLVRELVEATPSVQVQATEQYAP